MQKDVCVDVFKRIPLETHQQVNLVLRNCFVVSVEVVVRFEETYMVVRGREGGTADEGRGFFVPYEEISYFRIERPVRVGELKTWYGETGYVDAEDRLSAPAAKPATAAPETTPQNEPPAPVTVGSGIDPGSIAKQNLLNRIRAARANVAGATGRLGGNK
jgi:hypothetical protein